MDIDMALVGEICALAMALFLTVFYHDLDSFFCWSNVQKSPRYRPCYDGAAIHHMYKNHTNKSYTRWQGGNDCQQPIRYFCQNID